MGRMEKVKNGMKGRAWKKSDSTEKKGRYGMTGRTRKASNRKEQWESKVCGARKDMEGKRQGRKMERCDMW